ncbi:uncharacterized protein LOC123308516 [Coccinella septempunctata]|uniref:uncharacterized protein LOC123308516 n=1 Tax=Coccinella septempunctata TaxID=41139 RepID=UPI001D099349|nr:uncharacterized protein LOC123308516 [Coccinella septempunctata]
MLDWMKAKKGTFFSHEEAKTFFEGIRKDILGTIWFNMKDPVTLFTGRKGKLSDLHKALQRNQGKNKGTVISQMTCISGLGGIGKSELARKYAYDHCNDYDGNVIWINAENNDTLKDSFLNLARDDKVCIPIMDKDRKEKEIETIVKEIYGFFAKRKSLFIFDNAEKNDDLNTFLPHRDLPPNANKPYLLITSRNREWGKGIELIDLKELELEEAIEFVKTGLGISKEDESQDQEIKNLVEKLQCFPLFIQQAIAYIEDQRVTGEFGINDYLKEYEKKTKDLLDSNVFRGIDNHYATTTFKTWKITIDKIASNEQHGELALKILDTISYFAPENISRETFLSLAESEEKLRLASRLLVNYSMVNGGQQQSVLSIHRLVQEVIRINLKGVDRDQEVLREALGLWKDNIKEFDVDHPMSVWGYASSNHELVNEFSKLPRKIVHKLFDDRKYDKAFKFVQEALESLKILGDEHLQVAIMNRYLANAHGDRGEYDEKRKILENEVLPILRKCHSDKPVEIARTLRNLGVVYGNLQDYEKQKNYLKEACKLFEENLAYDDIELAKAKRNLANAYGDFGRYEEKRAILEDEILPILEEHHSDKPVEIARTLRNLGVVYGNLQDYEKQKNYLKEACKLFEENLAYDDIELAKAKRNLANAYGGLGDYEKKRAILEEEVLPIFEKFYGDDHVEVAEAKEEVLPFLKKKSEFDNSKLISKLKSKSQKNLSKAYEKLGYPLHAAVICGNKDKVEEELKKHDVNR